MFSTTSNKIAEGRLTCFVFHLREKAFTLPPLSMMWSPHRCCLGGWRSSSLVEVYSARIQFSSWMCVEFCWVIFCASVDVILEFSSLSCRYVLLWLIVWKCLHICSAAWSGSCGSWLFIALCGIFPLWNAGSVVVALGLSRLMASGVLVLPPGIEPTSPALQGGFLTAGPPRKSQHWLI